MAPEPALMLPLRRVAQIWHERDLMRTGVRAAAALAVWTATLDGMATPRPAVAANAFPPFPVSESPALVARWLASQTDLPLSSVVLVGPGYIFAFVADPPDQGDGLVWKEVREEVTNLAMLNRLNGRSATATVAFDCRQNQATASDVTVFAGNSLQGAPGRATPAADWLTANPGLYLMDLAKAACNPGFHRPFTGPPPAALPESAPAPTVNGPPRRTAAAETGPAHWVQVGAFTSGAAASQRWREIQRQAPAQSAGRSLRTEPVGAGKTLVRALVGPFRGSSAQVFCTVVKAHGGDCLVR
jgi:transposase